MPEGEGTYGPESISGIPASPLGNQPAAGAVSVTTTGDQILGSNPKRVAALIVNDGDDIVYLKLGSGPAVINSGLRINPQGGSFQIDRNFPWAGDVYGIVITTTSVVVVTEVSVQE
jgi:hypothetical protein